MTNQERMKPDFVSMDLSINVACPNEDCNNVFDLFDIDGLNDDGFLINLVCPKDGFWGCKDFQKQLDAAGDVIKCPDCGTIIEIDSIDW